MTYQHLSHKDYTIGWICALPTTEIVAAAAMLDEEHPVLPAADPQDMNSYLLGKIGNHNVVIACLPAEMTGKVSAATVAKDMLRSFPSIRFGLMVGIGGGVPYQGHDEDDDSEESDDDDTAGAQDIRLGDVVVSLQSKSTEAVVQYDFGKSLQGKEFIHSGGKLNKPPHIVLNAVAKLQADHARGRYKIPELLSRMVADNPAMASKFQYQGSEKDRLFKSDIIHVDGKKSCKACYGPDNINLIRRRDRPDVIPRIHYGTIGSADQVMKDAILRDKWASENNIICFEMEAAGLMDSFPCLIIRGICDYADSHKSKIWQPYAAATAASYAKELLLVIPGQGITTLSPIRELSEISKQLETGFEKAFQQQESHHHEQIVQNLTKDQHRCHQTFKTSIYEDFKNINPHRVAGTCEWVLNSPEYLRWWQATNSDLLWISADPGCGKSVLAKSLVDDIFKAADSSLSIIYFFFKDNDEQNRLAIALCAVLHQLFSLQPQLLQHALPFWERNKEKLRHEVEDLWRIFMAAISDPTSSKIICVFDALDECQKWDRERFIEKLDQYQTSPRPSNETNWLKFLVTSRPYDDIKHSFESITAHFPQIHLHGEEENRQIHNEINLVVKVKVDELSKSLKLDSKTQERLQNELLLMEHRTYLWLHLAIDDIYTTFKNSLRPNKASIRLIPKTVDTAYQKILDRVTTDQEENVKIILQIIVGARRPLTVQEMAMALGVATSGDVQTTQEAVLEIIGLSDKLRHWCGLFIFVRDFRIYLIHQTAREFLIKKAYWEQSATDIEMSRICVKYLLMDDLVRNDDETTRSLLRYSAENWADHFRHVPSPEHELLQSVCEIYNNLGSERFSLWFPKFWSSKMPHSPIPKMNAIDLAAFNGHGSILTMLDAVKNGGEIDEVDGLNANTLQWACVGGNCEIVKILIEKGADINAQSRYGNALQAASKEGHLEIVQLLLDKGADISARSQDSNALQTASEEGHLEIVQLLLEKGADINAQSGFFYGNALEAAANNGHLDIVQLLIEKGADINAQIGYYSNALGAASYEGNLEIVKLLLEKGAYVNIKGQGHNALYTASLYGHLEIVQLLLEKGADVNTKSQGPSALFTASLYGYLEIVQLLLKNGADVNDGGQHSLALLIASEQGHLEIVQLLLENGADANDVIKCSSHAALQEVGDGEIIKLLKRYAS